MKEISGYTQIAGRIATPTVAAATKATRNNVKKLKIYLRKNGNSGQKVK